MPACVAGERSVIVSPISGAKAARSAGGEKEHAHRERLCRLGQPAPAPNEQLLATLDRRSSSSG